MTTIPDFTPPDPHAFTLYGETFHLMGAFPRETLNALTEFQDGIASLNGDMNATARAAAMLDALYGLLPLLVVHEDRERFTVLMSDQDRPVGVVQLQALMTYAVEVTTGRPTEPPSDSSAGSPPDGGSSTATASSEA